MAGPNLEVFKFSVYVFFPVVMLMYYGNPDWYAKNVLPVRILPRPFVPQSALTSCMHIYQYKDKIFPPEHRLVTVRRLALFRPGALRNAESLYRAFPPIRRH